MTIPVFAQGANPHTSAPLFWSKPKALSEGLKRLRIRKVGDHYFRAEQASYVPGPKPQFQYVASKPKSHSMGMSELPGVRFHLDRRPRELTPEAVPMAAALEYVQRLQMTF